MNVRIISCRIRKHHKNWQYTQKHFIIHIPAARKPHIMYIKRHIISIRLKIHHWIGCCRNNLSDKFQHRNCHSNYYSYLEGYTRKCSFKLYFKHWFHNFFLRIFIQQAATLQCKGSLQLLYI